MADKIISVRLRAMVDDYERKMAGAAASTGRWADSAIKSADKVGRQMQDVGGKLTLGVTVPLAALGTVAIRSASDQEQAMGAVGAVYGDLADKVEDMGDRSAEAFGLAKSESMNMAAIVGSQLINMGFAVDEAADKSELLIGVAADLAAQYGGSTAEAIEAVSSLLRGERDPIERYAVSIKQADVDARSLALGLDTSTTAAQKHADAVATLDILMEQTASSQGAFARETDTAAGSMQIATAKFKDAAAELGQHLLPLVVDAAEFASDVLDAFSALPEGTQKAIVGFAGVAAATGPLLVGLGSVLRALGTIKTTLGAITLGPWGIALAGVAAIAGMVGRAHLDAQKDIKDFTGTLDQATGAITANTEEWVTNQLAQKGAFDAARTLGIARKDMIAAALGEEDAIGRVNSRISTLLDNYANGGGAAALLTEGHYDLGTSLNTVTNSLDSVGIFVDRTTEKFQAEKDAVLKANTAAADAGGIHGDLAWKMEGAADAAERQGGEQNILAQMIDRVTGAITGQMPAAIAEQKRLNEELEREAAAAQAATEAMQAKQDLIRASVDPVFAFRQAVEGMAQAERDHEAAVREVEDAEEAVSTARKEHGKKSDEYAEAQRRLEDAHRGVEDSQWNLLDASTRLMTQALETNMSFDEFDATLRAAQEQGHLTEGQAEDLRDEFRELQGQARDTKGEADGLAGTLGDVEAAARDAEREADQLRQTLSKLKDRSVNVQVRYSASGGTALSIPGGGSYLIGTSHQGGPITPDMSGWMPGLRPDERMRVLQVGEVVLSRSQVAQVPTTATPTSPTSTSKTVNLTVNGSPRHEDWFNARDLMMAAL